MHAFQRRQFLSSLLAIPAVFQINPEDRRQRSSMAARGLKTSLNAFSFNDPLLKGEMNIANMLDFCAETGFDGVDITGYYFKGYPQAPPDAYLFDIKRKAFDLGLEISGTGVRNDFTIADKQKRSAEIDLVKTWVEVAAKIGAPVVRIFAGNQKNENIAREKITGWMLEDMHTCVEFGKQHGIIIGLQNHHDFIQTADQLVDMIKAVSSPWLGIILDTGSYRMHDPYEEIKKSIPYAVNWQIKEKVFIQGKEVDTDIPKLLRMIADSGYRGYLPIETLGAGDPKMKITVLYNKLTTAMQSLK